MKKILAIALVGLALNASAKNYLGVKGGYSMTTGKTENSSSNKNVSNYTFGFSYDHTSLIGLNFGVELLFEQRGYKPNLSTLPSANYSYVSLPLKIGYKAGNKIYGFANVGVIPALLLKSEYRQTSASLPEQTYDFTKQVNKLDVAGLGELGIGYKFAPALDVYLSGRYQYSVTNSSPNDILLGNSPSLQQSGATIFLGVRFGL